MNPNREQLFGLYDAFNKRDIEPVIAMMHPLVAWANGMNAGFINGRDGVREYWLAQFQMINPQFNPLDYSLDNQGKAILKVRQVVHDLYGQLLFDKTVSHIFSFEGGLIRKYEIAEIS